MSSSSLDWSIFIVLLMSLFCVSLVSENNKSYHCFKAIGLYAKLASADYRLKDILI